MLKATPLHCAAAAGKSAQLGALIKLGVAVDAANCYGDTPLLVACGAHEPEVVKRLLAAGADPTTTNNNGQHALHMAVAGVSRKLRVAASEKENVDDDDALAVVKLLLADPKTPLAKRCDPNCVDSNGQTPLHHVAGLKERPATVALAKLLLSSGARAKVADASGKRPSEIGAGRATPRGELTALLKRHEMLVLG